MVYNTGNSNNYVASGSLFQNLSPLGFVVCAVHK